MTRAACGDESGLRPSEPDLLAFGVDWRRSRVSTHDAEVMHQAPVIQDLKDHDHRYRLADRDISSMRLSSADCQEGRHEGEEQHEYKDGYAE
jgi:hypothetical protein